MTVKLIVIDLDETLLRQDKSYDIERFDSALRKLRQQDTKVCIATGNSYHKIIDYFDDEAREGLYFACDNGNYIVKNEELVGQTTVDDETLHKIVEFIDEFEGYHILVGGGQVSYFREASGHGYDHISKYNNKIAIVDSFEEMEEDHFASKIAIYSEHSLDQNKVMTRILNGRFDDVAAVTSGDSWLDVYSIDGGKGSAVRYLQEKYHVSKEDTMTFGDSMNDESMMTEAKYSIAMGNADRELLLSANYQIGTNEESAVINIIEELANQQTTDFMQEYLIHQPR